MNKLRTYPTIDRPFAFRWLLSGLAAVAVGTAIGQIFGSLTPSGWTSLLLVLISTLGIGLTLGAIQAWVWRRSSVQLSTWLKWTALGFLSAMIFDFAWSNAIGLIYVAWNNPETIWVGQHTFTFVQFAMHYAVLCAVQSLAFPKDWCLRGKWVGLGVAIGALGTIALGALGVGSLLPLLLVATQLLVLIWRFGWDDAIASEVSNAS